eukprot:COSAG04_NODE_68_length_29323_cov_9.683514_2_plen_107_part_00
MKGFGYRRGDEDECRHGLRGAGAAVRLDLDLHEHLACFPTRRAVAVGVNVVLRSTHARLDHIDACVTRSLLTMRSCIPAGHGVCDAASTQRGISSDTTYIKRSLAQ